MGVGYLTILSVLQITKRVEGSMINIAITTDPDRHGVLRYLREIFRLLQGKTAHHMFRGVQSGRQCPCTRKLRHGSALFPHQLHWLTVIRVGGPCK
jgi:hypothetical protein